MQGGTFFPGAVSGLKVRGGVAVILVYVVIAGFKAGAIVGGKALAFTSSEDLIFRRKPLI